MIARVRCIFEVAFSRAPTTSQSRFRRCGSPTISCAPALHQRSHPLRATRRDQAWLQLLASCRRVGSTTSSRDAIGLTVGAEDAVHAFRWKAPRLHPIYEPPPSTPQTAMNLSARKFKRGEAVEPAGALAHSSPRKVQDRPDAVFVSPPRKTYADDASGDSLACAAPGYYDKSVLTAPWSLSGRVAGEATRLSAAFLAPGRTNMLLPQQEDVLMDRGSSPTPASPLSPEEEIEQISRAKKLRRQQREVEAMAMEKKRAPEPT